MTRIFPSILLGLLLVGLSPGWAQQQELRDDAWLRSFLKDQEARGIPVTRLELFDAEVTEAGLKELKEHKQLTALFLKGTQVTDAGLTELKELKRLTNLVLVDTKVTDAGQKELRAALPRCKIWR